MHDRASVTAASRPSAGATGLRHCGARPTCRRGRLPTGIGPRRALRRVRECDSRPAARGTRRAIAWHGPCCEDAPGSHVHRAHRRTGVARPAAEGRRARPSLRLPDHQLDGRDLDRRARADRLRAGGDAEDDGGPGRSPESPRVARREPLRAAREHDRPPPRRTDLLVLRHGLHLHPRRELDQPLPGRRHDRLGSGHRARLRRAAAALPRRERGSQPDAGDGPGVLRLLDLLGAP